MPTLPDLTWPMRTERLSVRPAVEADLERIWQVRRQESVGRWMTDASKDLDAFVALAHEVKRVESTLILERDGGYVGETMLRIEDAYAQSEVKEQAIGVNAEIGWCLDPAYEGNGYATEAAREMLRISFAELGLHRVTALCFAGNTASWRLMERIGMRREAHHVGDSLHRELGWVDGYVYAMLADEWRALQA